MCPKTQFLANGFKKKGNEFCDYNNLRGFLFFTARLFLDPPAWLRIGGERKKGEEEDRDRNKRHRVQSIGKA